MGNLLFWDNAQRLFPPVSYQGGKQRIASKIVDYMKINPGTMFWDLCCGSGAISIELINRGHSPTKIFMLDKSPWGLFWMKVGDGTFDVDRFKQECEKVPVNKQDVKKYMEELSRKPTTIERLPCVFLLLQAASFGTKAIWAEKEANGLYKWKNCSFKNYWRPTKTSSRRYPVNPMMPMPGTLIKRAKAVCKAMKGVQGYFGDINDVAPLNGVVYIDPPYSSRTTYGYTFDVLKYAKRIPVKCYISEGKPLSDKAIRISGSRSKGGITGTRQIRANEEWLSVFN